LDAESMATDSAANALQKSASIIKAMIVLFMIYSSVLQLHLDFFARQAFHQVNGILAGIGAAFEDNRTHGIEPGIINTSQFTVIQHV